MVTKHDVIFVYHDFGLHSTQMTCGKRLEIEYVIGSLKRYCSSWLGNIYVIGSVPPEPIRKDVIHIPCDNPFKHCKDANIIHKVRYACENVKELSDDFLMVSDDQIVTKNTVWEDFQPRIEKDYTDTKKYNDRWWKNRIARINDNFQENLYATLKKFPDDRRYRFQAHIWSPINKTKFIEMCKKYDYQHDNGCVIYTLYYNFIKQPIVKDFDHKTFYNFTATNRKKLPTHIGWFDKAFQKSEFRSMLENICFGPVIKTVYNPKGNDAVFVLGTKSLNGKNEEIQVAVASLRKYCTSWLKRIYVVGENPHIEGVIHIPAKDIYTHDKDANIIHKVRVACEKIKDLSDDFLMCSDDQLVTKESKFDDFKPRYLEIYDPEKPYWKAKSRSTLWAKRLCMTMERFGKGARYFEPHIFSPMNKKKFLAMCKVYNYKIENGITIFSLYYNFIGEKGVPHFDHYSVQKPPYKIPDNVRCIGYFDSAFKNDTFRRKLNEITGADIEVATVPEGGKNKQTYKKASTPQEILIEPMITNKLGQLKMNGTTKTAQATIVEAKSKRPSKRAIPISDVMPLETIMLLRQANNLEKKKKSTSSNPITQKHKNAAKEAPETPKLKKDYAKYGFRGWTNNM